MKTIKNSKGVETLIFAETFENEAYEQVKKLANYEPYLDSKIRIMPDAHAGEGCTVGTTMTITDKVTPNLVGVDIGCGMLTVEIKNRNIDFGQLNNIIRTEVPSGFNVHKEPIAGFDFNDLRCATHVDLVRAAQSLGTLGGGNHFIEIDRSEDGAYYLVIHSGSRKLGGDVCKYYQDLAFQSLNEMSKVRENLIKSLKAQGREAEIPDQLKMIQKPSADKDLAHLSGQGFNDYMNDMRIVQKYASANRKTMMHTIVDEMGFEINDVFETIHNYINFEDMILRKGAIQANKNQRVLIPINMRDGSIVAFGKGNPDWNNSAPHGAGRLMSRSKAKEVINMDSYTKQMSGIYTTSVDRSTLDEAPDAYKSLDEILRTIVDTVDVYEIIKPVYNFKAH